MNPTQDNNSENMDTDTRTDIPDDGQTNLQQTVVLDLLDGDIVDMLLANISPNMENNRNESIEDIEYSGKCVTNYLVTPTPAQVTQVPVESTASSDLISIPVTINYVHPIDQKPYTLETSMFLDPDSLTLASENNEETTAPPNACDNETVESENPESSDTSDNGAVQSNPPDAQQLQELPQNPSNKRKLGPETNENGIKLARLDKEDGQKKAKDSIQDLFAAVINKTSPEAAASTIANITKILMK